ncbi:UNKNOWN [Stylonychia lemnae]|uniref:Uncharacterized protein n=1 Tax=Stylonychia lemnae TaxID=5949 RepID=A0A078B8C0_STYLE|nr:UNKNOWN [Stylonychia lemnae]|eukprot:CDW89808.1 UNKNOWN [Stylonychia lemnae]
MEPNQQTSQAHKNTGKPTLSSTNQGKIYSTNQSNTNLESVNHQLSQMNISPITLKRRKFKDIQENDQGKFQTINNSFKGASRMRMKINQSPDDSILLNQAEKVYQKDAFLFLPNAKNYIKSSATMNQSYVDRSFMDQSTRFGGIASESKELNNQSLSLDQSHLATNEVAAVTNITFNDLSMTLDKSNLIYPQDDNDRRPFQRDNEMNSQQTDADLDFINEIHATEDEREFFAKMHKKNLWKFNQPSISEGSLDNGWNWDDDDCPVSQSALDKIKEAINNTFIENHTFNYQMSTSDEDSCGFDMAGVYHKYKEEEMKEQSQSYLKFNDFMPMEEMLFPEMSWDEYLIQQQNNHEQISPCQ